VSQPFDRRGLYTSLTGFNPQKPKLPGKEPCYLDYTESSLRGG